MSLKSLTTPVLFLIFNRPETTAKVFERIRAVRPKYLYVAADGPRKNKEGEKELCEQARKVVLDGIDWECELKTRFLDTNLGCKMAVSSAITWFFENVEEGIILEDDCLPDVSFFGFCAELLEYYRNNKRIMHIGGANFQDGRFWGDGSYYASTLGHIWGWATWKRAWKFYDVNMINYPNIRNDLKKIIFDPQTEKYWRRNFDSVYYNKKDTWDLQWQFTIFVQKGIAIHPNRNLVTNLGFGAQATHTIDSFHPLSNCKQDSIEFIQHPSKLNVFIEADRYTYQRYLNPPKIIKVFYLLRRFFDFSLKKILK